VLDPLLPLVEYSIPSAISLPPFIVRDNPFISGRSEICEEGRKWGAGWLLSGRKVLKFAGSSLTAFQFTRIRQSAGDLIKAFLSAVGGPPD